MAEANEKQSAQPADDESLTKQPIGKLEASLWKSADKLRKNIDAAEYKHVVLGLIFLKYIFAHKEEKKQSFSPSGRDGREGEILFIDARNLGHLIKRRTKVLSEEDIQTNYRCLPQLAQS